MKKFITSKPMAKIIKPATKPIIKTKIKEAGPKIGIPDIPLKTIKKGTKW
jgi:hypothetical protein